ncbi:MAG: methyltransferase [Bacteroidota bacterium]
MRRIVRSLAAVFYKPLLVKWLSKERVYTYQGTRLKIHPQVFHPGFFFSTKILLQNLAGLSLQDKKLLELGAGSGLISISAAKAGAMVTATDINPIAIDYLRQNMLQNGVDLKLIFSDLFTMIPKQCFDIIAINPPYYFQAPANFAQYAWYCGSNGEYFHALFKNLSNYIDQKTVILMVLCEGSNRAAIQSIGKEYGFGFECVQTAQNLIERNYIYQIHTLPGHDPVSSVKHNEKDIIIQPQEQ